MIRITLWLVAYLPLWKIWVRQLGWWHSKYMESHKSHVPNHQPDPMVFLWFSYSFLWLPWYVPKHQPAIAGCWMMGFQPSLEPSLEREFWNSFHDFERSCYHKLLAPGRLPTKDNHPWWSHVFFTTCAPLVKNCATQNHVPDRMLPQQICTAYDILGCWRSCIHDCQVAIWGFP